MFILRYVFAATSVAAFFGLAHAAETADVQYQRMLDQRPSHVGEQIVVDVDLSTEGLDADPQGERIALHYGMAFKQIAEGWSWQPLADPAAEDYYRFNYLPLQSVLESRGSYAGEDKIGESQQMDVVWRYDYFLAFANLYDFYPRRVDDQAGFSADVPASLAGHVGLRAIARLVEPVTSESTTFWKAIHGRPVDYTLKKRYLVAQLEEVDFVELESGRVLCRIKPGQDRCSAS